MDSSPRCDHTCLSLCTDLPGRVHDMYIKGSLLPNLLQGQRSQSVSGLDRDALLDVLAQLQRISCVQSLASQDSNAVGASDQLTTEQQEVLNTSQVAHDGSTPLLPHSPSHTDGGILRTVTQPKSPSRQVSFQSPRASPGASAFESDNAPSPSAGHGSDEASNRHEKSGAPEAQQPYAKCTVEASLSGALSSASSPSTPAKQRSAAAGVSAPALNSTLQKGHSSDFSAPHWMLKAPEPQAAHTGPIAPSPAASVGPIRTRRQQPRPRSASPPRTPSPHTPSPGAAAAPPNLPPCWVPSGASRATFNRYGADQAAVGMCRRLGIQCVPMLVSSTSWRHAAAFCCCPCVRWRLASWCATAAPSLQRMTAASASDWQCRGSQAKRNETEMSISLSRACAALRFRRGRAPQASPSTTPCTNSPRRGTPSTRPPSRPPSRSCRRHTSAEAGPRPLGRSALAQALAAASAVAHRPAALAERGARSTALAPPRPAARERRRERATFSASAAQLALASALHSTRSPRAAPHRPVLLGMASLHQSLHAREQQVNPGVVSQLAQCRLHLSSCSSNTRQCSSLSSRQTSGRVVGRSGLAGTWMTSAHRSSSDRAPRCTTALAPALLLINTVANRDVLAEALTEVMHAQAHIAQAA
jgi:hypothetical protein